MKKWAVLACFLLVGCADMGKTETIYLRKPGSTETVKCGPYTELFQSQTVEAQVSLRSCVQDFQRQGYERVAGP